MALFFSGFEFFRNLLAPSHNGISFRKIRVEKINLIRLLLWEGKKQDMTPQRGVMQRAGMTPFPFLLAFASILLYFGSLQAVMAGRVNRPANFYYLSDYAGNAISCGCSSPPLQSGYTPPQDSESATINMVLPSFACAGVCNATCPIASPNYTRNFNRDPAEIASSGAWYKNVSFGGWVARKSYNLTQKTQYYQCDGSISVPVFRWSWGIQKSFFCGSPPLRSHR